MIPVYPKDNGSLKRAKAAFLERVKRTNWNDEEECLYKRRGRKPKSIIRFESKPRTLGERRVWEQQSLKQDKYNWL